MNIETKWKWRSINDFTPSPPGSPSGPDRSPERIVFDGQSMDRREAP